MRTSSIAIVLWLLFPVLLAPAGSRTAYAHAAYDRSEPAAGATVAASPAAVKVWFTETLADGSWLSVLDAQAQQADLNDSAIDSSDSTNKLMAVSLKSDLPVGVYTVKWKSVSADDGDNVTGEFEFSVGHGAPAPAPAPPTVTSTGGIAAEVAFAQPTDGATITGGDVELQFHTNNVTLMAMGSTAAAPAGTLGGHLHVLVDGVELGMSSAPVVAIRGLSNGPHTLTVTLSDNKHLPYDPPVRNTIRITIADSNATTPATFEIGGIGGGMDAGMAMGDDQPGMAMGDDQPEMAMGDRQSDMAMGDMAMQEHADMALQDQPDAPSDSMANMPATMPMTGDDATLPAAAGAVVFGLLALAAGLTLRKVSAAAR